jgi:hypothetical protein
MLTTCPARHFHLALIAILAYFPGVARVFIYPSLIVICVPSLADNVYTLLGGILPTRRLIYILLHLRTNYTLTWIRLTNCNQS